MGYGIRYQYGMFKQEIVDGQQVEKPDLWLIKDMAWQFARPNKHYPVAFWRPIAAASTPSNTGSRLKKSLRWAMMKSFRLWWRCGQPLALVDRTCRLAV